MSIKIYNGFKIDDLTTFLLELNQYKRSIIKDYNAKSLAEWCTLRYFRDQNFFETKTLTVPFRQYIRTLKQDFEENKRLASEEYVNKYDVSISYSPVHQIGFIHAEETDHDTHIMHFQSVKEYNYYDHTDKPEYMSDDEWAERGETWSNALDKGYTVGVGYNEFLHIDVFTEPFNYTNILVAYEEHKDTFLHVYITNSVLDNAVALFGSDKDRYAYNQYKANNQYMSMFELQRTVFKRNNQGEEFIQTKLKEYKL